MRHSFAAFAVRFASRAGIAQSVERLIRNQQVRGSIPRSGTSHEAGESSATRVDWWTIVKDSDRKSSFVRHKDHLGMAKDLPTGRGPRIGDAGSTIVNKSEAAELEALVRFWFRRLEQEERALIEEGPTADDRTSSSFLDIFAEMFSPVETQRRPKLRFGYLALLEDGERIRRDFDRATRAFESQVAE